ncbi:DsbA family protein [bacterium]|nr:DsbA family protein [bacterium]
MLKIYLDFKSPMFYLAYKPTLAMIERHQMVPEWIPFRSIQEPVPLRLAEETKTQTHLRIRAEARLKTHLMYAEYQKLPMKFPPVPGETDLALAALLHLQTDPGNFIQAALEAYWIKNADLNSFEVVSSILSDVGIDPAQCDFATYLTELEAIQKDAWDGGVVDAPAYVIGGQVFIGREHFPWIESLIVAQKRVASSLSG